MPEIALETMGYGPTQIQDLALGKKIMAVIEKFYPQHNWLVDSNHQAGHGSIQLMYEGKDKSTRVWKYGYLFHIHKLGAMTEHEFEKRIRDAAGEILERYKMARTKARESDLIDFLEHGIVDAANMIVESRH